MINLRALAKQGAVIRLAELDQEKQELIRMFDLPGDGPKRGRRTMSRAARAAVSERMRKYWAARRKGK